MFLKAIPFIKRNYLWLSLIAYGFFVVFYKWSGGSFMGDEATYSQVARESLHDNSYFIFHWKRALWMEKPPLVIWLTILAFKLWGISETSAHVFPGIFSVLSAVILFFIGKNLFRSDQAGFFSGFVFLTTPMIVMYTRVNMMDIPVGMFLALSAMSLIKIFQGREKWWLVFGLSTGLAVMTKSVVGALPFALAFVSILIFNNFKACKSRYFAGAMLIFMIAIVPWHIFMTVKFGMSFWRDYFGFHVWERYIETILPYPWEGNSRWAYLKLLWLRSGIWFFLFLVFSLTSVSSFLPVSFKKYARTFASGTPFGKKFQAWLKRQKKELLFIYAWLAIVFVPFFFSATKLPNYMILSFFPLSVAAGGSLFYLFKEKNAKWLFFVSGVSLLNFLPRMRLHASDYGEAHLLSPKILVRYLGFNDSQLIFVMAAALLVVMLVFLKFHENKKIIGATTLLIILSMNTLVPFSPFRNEFIKKFAGDLSVLNNGQPVKLLALTKPDHFSFHCVGAFYLPVGSRIDNISGYGMMSLTPVGADDTSFCFIERGLETAEMKDKRILSYKEGIVVNCRASD